MSDVSTNNISGRIAVVTGASSGIGREIAGQLLEKGATVFGGGRCFKAEDLENGGFFGKFGSRFVPVIGDFAETCGAENFAESIKKALKKELNGSKTDILVNCAGSAFYGLHESLDGCKIHKMVAVNIEAPMILSSVFLKDLRETRGAIINVSSVTAKNTSNTHGCAYGATKAALTSFGVSLFEEVRKHGVRVCNIHPDLTETDLYRNADFTVSGEALSCLFAKEVAAAAISCLETREGLVVTDITVRPSVNKIIKKQVK